MAKETEVIAAKITQHPLGGNAIVTNGTVKDAEQVNQKRAEDPKQMGTWTNLLKGNRSAVNDMTLSYIPPQLQRTTLWGNLKEVAHGISIPWIVTGDFNAVMLPQDRMFGYPVTYAETKDYVDCMQGLMLNKLQWKVMAHLKHNIKVPFKIFNVWANHDSFLQLVEQIWKNNMADNKMKDIWLKLKTLRPLLKQLNNEEFKFISHKIKKTRDELINTQENISNKYSDELVEMERQQLHNLEKWSMIEEKALHQKSKAHWIRLGDANTKYFSTIVK
ncbi:uncharacterized protein LOC142168283 [Nicotiana tabacum]|uniref:Uncharacterized protein LOC142168283 n=1 Tax=Nicotiana tabacum TaxID=4097 RepID=A0AC58SJA0_TOBAC